MMTLHFMMSFAHTEKDGLSIIIKRAYLNGTEDVLTNRIVVYGPYDDPQQVHLVVLPITAKPGKKLKRKVIFVDQFNDKHVSEEITFHPNPHPVSGISNCHFCGKPIESGAQAQEAEVYAHKNCVWP